MFDLAKTPGTNKQRAEIYRTQRIINRIENEQPCALCAHWNDGECDINDIDATQDWVCSRNCEDLWEPKEGAMDE